MTEYKETSFFDAVEEAKHRYKSNSIISDTTYSGESTTLSLPDVSIVLSDTVDEAEVEEYIPPEKRRGERTKEKNAYAIKPSSSLSLPKDPLSPYKDSFSSIDSTPNTLNGPSERFMANGAADLVNSPKIEGIKGFKRNFSEKIGG